MEALKTKLPEGVTHYLIGENTTPILDLLVFENSITITEHMECGYGARLYLDKEESSDGVLCFTTRIPGISSYFKYQIDMMVDLTEKSPIFSLCSGIPILWLFNETYILKVRGEG